MPISSSSLQQMGPILPAFADAPANGIHQARLFCSYAPNITSGEVASNREMAGRKRPDGPCWAGCRGVLCGVANFFPQSQKLARPDEGSREKPSPGSLLMLVPRHWMAAAAGTALVLSPAGP